MKNTVKDHIIRPWQLSQMAATCVYFHPCNNYIISTKWIILAPEGATCNYITQVIPQIYFQSNKQ